MWKKLWRRLFVAKRPFKLTGPGWVFILYTIGVGAGAINTGNNLLYLVFGVFLGLILASGFLSDLSLWGVDIETTFPQSTSAGENASLFLNLTNTKKRLPSLSIIVTLEGELRGKPVQLVQYIPLIGTASSMQTRLEWAAPARGWFQLRNIRLSTRYPFGLLEKWWRMKLEALDNEGFFITPAVHAVDLETLRMETQGQEKTRENSERGDSSSLFGIRPYVPGDNPRRIHWKVSAKRAPTDGTHESWVVREMTREEKETIALELPSGFQTENLTEEDSERLVRFAASLSVAFRTANNEVYFFLNQKKVREENPFLALWEPRQPSTERVDKYLMEDENEAPAKHTINVWEAFHAQNAA